MNQFSERMSTLSNENLLKMLDQRNDYQPEAILAAENELKNRKLTNVENNEKKDIKESKRKINKKTFFKVKETRENAKLITADIPDTNNLLSNVIYWLKVATVIILYTWFLLSGFNYISVGAQILLIILVIAGIQLWRKKNSGWIILTFIITCNLLLLVYISIFEIIQNLKIKSVILYDYRNSILPLIGITTFWFFINSKYFTKHLEITKKTQLITQITSVLFIAIAIVAGLITTK